MPPEGTVSQRHAIAWWPTLPSLGGPSGTRGTFCSTDSLTLFTSQSMGWLQESEMKQWSSPLKGESPSTSKTQEEEVMALRVTDDKTGIWPRSSAHTFQAIHQPVTWAGESRYDWRNLVVMNILVFKKIHCIKRTTGNNVKVSGK